MTSIRESLVLDGLDLNAGFQPPAASGYSAAVLADTPALYWRLGESSGPTAADASGNGRTGTYGAGVTFSQTGAISGDANTAILFTNATTSSVAATYSPFTNGTSRTFEGWFKRNNSTGDDALFASDGANLVYLRIDAGGTTVRFDPNASAGTSFTWTSAWPGNGVYVHWVLTFNETTDVAELWINGVSKGTVAATDAYGASPGNFRAGCDSAGNAGTPDGYSDEVAVYTSILTGTQILNHYNLGIGAAVGSPAGAFILQGYDVPPPNKRQEWAQGADIDGALLVRDPLFDNREITLRLRVAQQATMDDALTQISLISKKLEEAEQQPDGLPLIWQPAGSTKRVTFYVLSGVVEGLPITLSGDDAGWFLRAPVVMLKLQCKPFWHGADITSSTTSAATPFVTTTITSVPGDVPALGRLLVTDAATQNRRYIEAGLQWRYYDAATSLIQLASGAGGLVTSGFSGVATTRTGAYS